MASSTSAVFALLKRGVISHSCDTFNPSSIVIEQIQLAHKGPQKAYSSSVLSTRS